MSFFSGRDVRTGMVGVVARPRLGEILPGGAFLTTRELPQQMGGGPETWFRVGPLVNATSKVIGETSGNGPALIVMVGTRACAIPVRHVAETMRPLPVELVAGTPKFIPGVSVIRGAAVPVVDLQVLLENGESTAIFGRFVTVKVGERRVALGVDRVVGLKLLDPTDIGELPPLLRDVDPDLIEAIGTSDAHLLVVLRAARIVPDEVWAVLAAKTDVR